MSLKRLLACGAALAAAAILPAHAGMKVADVVAAAKSFAGENAAGVELKTLESGNLFLAARMPNGAKYGAFFFHCGDDKRECGGLSFEIGFLDAKMDLNDMNAWNRKRLSQAYLDSDNDPTLQLYTHSTGPYGQASLGDLLEWWRSEAYLFHDYVYEESSRQLISAGSDEVSLRFEKARSDDGLLEPAPHESSANPRW